MRARERRLQELLEPAVEVLGYELVGVRFVSQGHNRVLRIYIDSDAGITVKDCERVSYQVSGVLDVEDPIHSRYTLEVSSPGLDRPLFTLAHFEQFTGETVQLNVFAPVEGRRKFKGAILGTADGSVRIDQDGAEVALEMSNIVKARLVPDYNAILASSKD